LHPDSVLKVLKPDKTITRSQVPRSGKTKINTIGLWSKQAALCKKGQIHSCRRRAWLLPIPLQMKNIGWNWWKNPVMALSVLMRFAESRNRL
jgi:hypothetical protein